MLGGVDDDDGFFAPVPDGLLGLAARLEELGGSGESSARVAPLEVFVRVRCCNNPVTSRDTGYTQGMERLRRSEELLDNLTRRPDLAAELASLQRASNLNSEHVDQKEQAHVWIEGGRDVVLRHPETRGLQRFRCTNGFSRLASDEDVSSVLARTLVEDWLLKGFNTTLFTWGKTQAGKTHTLSGTVSLQPSFVASELQLPASNASASVLWQCARLIFAANEQNSLSVAISCWEIRPDGSTVDLLSRKSGSLSTDRRNVGGSGQYTAVSCRTLAELAQTLELSRCKSRNWISRQKSAFTAQRNTAHSFLRLAVAQHDREILSVAHFIDVVGHSRVPPKSQQGQREHSSLNCHLLSIERLLSELSHLEILRASSTNLSVARDTALSSAVAPLLAGNSKCFCLANLTDRLEDYKANLATMRVATCASLINTACLRDSVDSTNHPSNIIPFASVAIRLGREPLAPGEISESSAKFNVDEINDVIVAAKEKDGTDFEDVPGNSKILDVSSDIETPIREQGEVSESEILTGRLPHPPSTTQSSRRKYLVQKKVTHSRKVVSSVPLDSKKAAATPKPKKFLASSARSTRKEVEPSLRSHDVWPIVAENPPCQNQRGAVNSFPTRMRQAVLENLQQAGNTAQMNQELNLVTLEDLMTPREREEAAKLRNEIHKLESEQRQLAHQMKIEKQHLERENADLKSWNQEMRDKTQVGSITGLFEDDAEWTRQSLLRAEEAYEKCQAFINDKGQNSIIETARDFIGFLKQNLIDIDQVIAPLLKREPQLESRQRFMENLRKQASDLESRKGLIDGERNFRSEQKDALQASVERAEKLRKELQASHDALRVARAKTSNEAIEMRKYLSLVANEDEKRSVLQKIDARQDILAYPFGSGINEPVQILLHRLDNIINRQASFLAPQNAALSIAVEKLGAQLLRIEDREHKYLSAMETLINNKKFT